MVLIKIKCSLRKKPFEIGVGASRSQFQIYVAPFSFDAKLDQKLRKHNFLIFENFSGIALTKTVTIVFR